jgi:hypothetical protein
MDERDEQIAELQRIIEAQGKQLALAQDVLADLGFDLFELAGAAEE